MNHLESNVEELKGGERIYPRAFNEAARDHKERYQLALNYIKAGDKVLDAATGVGYGAYYMAVNSGCEIVIGLDVNDHALEWGRTYFTSPKNLSFKVDLLSDFTDVLPVTQFDVVTCFETIEHLTADVDFLKRIHGLLKPGGVFLISSPNEEVIPCLENPFYVDGKNPHHHRHYRPSELRQILAESGFSVVDSYSQCPHNMIRGENGFVTVYVCTNVPARELPLNAVEQGIEKLNLLQMRKEFQFLETRASSATDITSIQHRIEEITVSYDALMTAFALIDQQRFDESLVILEAIDKSLCPESYFWLGLVYQSQNKLFQAVEMYSKILKEQARYSQVILNFAEDQLVKAINQMTQG